MDFLTKFTQNERKRTPKERFANFEHQLNTLFCELAKPVTTEDWVNKDTLSNSIIILMGKEKFGEDNEIFLENAKSDFYDSIKKIEASHLDTSTGLLYIRLFIEDFYINPIS